MEKDIVPNLIDKIYENFTGRVKGNPKVQKLIELLEDSKANYLDANEYSHEKGKALSEALKELMRKDILPDGKMYLNIAERFLNDTLPTNHKLISSYATAV